MAEKKIKVKVTENGPYLVEGGAPMKKERIVTDDAGYSVGWEDVKEYEQKESYSLCRCGQTKTAPYCDGSHVKAKFEGTETASRKPFDYQATKIEGPELILCDAEELCAFARFCDVGDRVWQLAEESDNPESKKLCIKEADLCPSGRLVVLDKKTGKSLEKKYEPQISLIDDPEQGVSGPIWLKGAVPVEAADGEIYEVREKQTLCRCGQSQNKPFCNGAHASCDYQAGD
jgi:CDGSH-type Zn-finger protein